MSASGRATQFMRAWGDGHGKPHDTGCQRWGADPCDRCAFDAFPDPWNALVAAATIAWPDLFADAGHGGMHSPNREATA